jgi:hypothetical protein
VDDVRKRPNNHRLLTNSAYKQDLHEWLDSEPLDGCGVQHSGLLGVAVIAICLVVAGCSAPSDNNTAGDPVVAELAAHELQTPGRPAEVVDQLTRIRDTGSVDYADYQEAARSWVDCVAKEGIAATLVPVKQFGLDLYSTSEQFPAGVQAGDATDETLRKASQACRDAWWAPVEDVYLNSPASLQTLEDSIAPFREAALSCLSRNGKPLEADATRDEIMRANADLTIATGTDCLENAGYLGQ